MTILPARGLPLDAEWAPSFSHWDWPAKRDGCTGYFTPQRNLEFKCISRTSDIASPGLLSEFAYPRCLHDCRRRESCELIHLHVEIPAANCLFQPRPRECRPWAYRVSVARQMQSRPLLSCNFYRKHRKHPGGKHLTISTLGPWTKLTITPPHRTRSRWWPAVSS